MSSTFRMLRGARCALPPGAGIRSTPPARRRSAPEVSSRSTTTSPASHTTSVRRPHIQGHVSGRFRHRRRMHFLAEWRARASTLSRFLNNLGLYHLVLHSDGEPAILQFATRIRAPAAREVNLRCSPRGSPQSSLARCSGSCHARHHPGQVRLQGRALLQHTWAARHAAWALTRYAT